MAHPDLDTLLNALIPFAQQKLAEDGEFYPFAASVTTEGEVQAIAFDLEDDFPTSDVVIEMLTEGIREAASQGEIRAAAICCDVRVVPPGQTEKVDAICVGLEHIAGESLSVMLTYVRDDDGDYSWIELFGGQRDARFFSEE